MSLDNDSEHRSQRWLTVDYVVVIAVVVNLVALQLLGGSHGPGRHLSSPGSSSAPVVLLPVDR